MLLSDRRAGMPPCGLRDEDAAKVGVGMILAACSVRYPSAALADNTQELRYIPPVKSNPCSAELRYAGE